MAEQGPNGISWTERTWNPIRGCSMVNDDCRNCYAMQVAARFSGAGQPYDGLAVQTGQGPRWTGKVITVPDHLKDPLRWKKPQLIFVNSMSDLFHEDLTDEQIDQVVAVMALAGQHQFQVLTKRPERMAAYLADRSKSIAPLQLQARLLGYTFDYQGNSLLPWPIPNIWWGASMGHQMAVDALLPHLMACRPHAKVLWVSAEPLTGPMTLHPPATTGQKILSRYYSATEFDPKGQQPEATHDWTRWPMIDWLVAGGESTTNARPMHPAWPVGLQKECARAGVAFHFKQWGEWVPKIYLSRGGTKLLNISCDGKGERIVSSGVGHTEDINMVRVGKRAAGRQLEGFTWDQYPLQGIVKQIEAERIN